ncbi:MAG: hypothetical protein R3182_06690, partial [Draconibacterium sp.]|nr:hypothetical protein [Draconibacterium sp.]
MLNHIFIAFIFVCLCSLNALSQTQNFFVSPTGNDTNPGTIESPVATFEGAQRLVRKFKKINPGIPVNVYFKGGKYYRTQSAVFISEDSGTKSAPVKYAAFPGEEPLILGGKKLLLKWEKFRDGIYKAQVPKGLIFESLFINDEEQVLARYPNYDPEIRIFNGTAEDCISKERVKKWKNPKDGYFHVIHKSMWGGFHFRILGKDKKGNIATAGRIFGIVLDKLITADLTSKDLID